MPRLGRRARPMLEDIWTLARAAANHELAVEPACLDTGAARFGGGRYLALELGAHLGDLLDCRFHVLLAAALRLDAPRSTHDGAEDQFRPRPALEGIDAESGTVVAEAVGNEQGPERPGGARHRRDVVVAVALYELRALFSQLARGDEARRDLPRAGEHALALERIAKIGEGLR